MLVMGTGLCKTAYKKMEPLLKKNEGLMETKAYYEKKIKDLEATIATNAAKTNAEMEELRSMLRNQGRTYMNDYSPPRRSNSNSGSYPRGRACGRTTQPDHAYGYSSGLEGAYEEDTYPEQAYAHASQPDDHAYGHAPEPDYAHQHTTQRKRVFGPVIQAEHAYGPNPPRERAYGQGTRRDYATIHRERPYTQATHSRPCADGESTRPGQSYGSGTETERAYAFLTRPRHANSVNSLMYIIS